MSRLTRSTGNTAGVFDDVTALAAVSSPNGRILSLSTGERYYTSSVDDGEGLLLIDGNYANPIYNNAPQEPNKEISFTGGGQIQIGEVNSLQDGDTGYTLPPANSGEDGEYLIITQALEFVNFEPVVTVNNATTETIVKDSGTDTAITFDQAKSKDIRLTTDGVNQWRLTV